VDMFRKAIELDGKDAASHALLGHFYLTSEKPEQASKESSTTLQLDPENPSALYQLSLLRRREGRTEEAERLLQRFQQAKTKQRPR
jgi:Flp pilus assembly protein TadD